METQTTSSAAMLFAIILIMLAAVDATGTTIVAVRNATEVVLAADSKDQHLDNGTSTSCKIFSCGDYFIAIAGVRDLHVRGIGFNAPSLVSQVCRTPGTPVETLARITDSLVPPFTQVMTELARRNPQKYRQSVEAKEAYVNILMVGFEHEIPFIQETDLVASLEISAGVATRSIVQNDKLPATGMSYVFIGRHEAIDQFVRTRTAFWRLGLVEGAKFLVTYEIADIPSVVGPPIDVVRINKNGSQWIQRKHECQ